MMREWLLEQSNIAGADIDRSVAVAHWIVDRNVLVGNLMATNADGNPSGRDELPILEYTWETRSLQVTVKRTTLGDILAEAAMEASDTTLSLFGPKEPTHVWTGAAADLCLLSEPVHRGENVPSRKGVTQ